MRRFWLVSLLLSAVMSGCATSHYVQREANTLVLYLQVPKAQQVQLASSADNFIPRETERVGTDTWRVVLPTVAELKYFYIVDGATYLPDCRFRETDDFGSENCIYQP
jgi:hypothetical protein